MSSSSSGQILKNTVLGSSLANNGLWVLGRLRETSCSSKGLYTVQETPDTFQLIRHNMPTSQRRYSLLLVHIKILYLDHFENQSFLAQQQRMKILPLLNPLLPGKQLDTIIFQCLSLRNPFKSFRDLWLTLWTYRSLMALYQIKWK